MTETGAVLLMLAIIVIAGAGGGIAGVLLVLFLVRREIRRRVALIKIDWKPPVSGEAVPPIRGTEV